MKLIADCRLWWRMWSVRLAALPALIAGYLTIDPSLLMQVVGFVPDRWRLPAAVAVALLTFVVPTLVRLMPQAKLKGETDAAS